MESSRSRVGTSQLMLKSSEGGPRRENKEPVLEFLLTEEQTCGGVLHCVAALGRRVSASARARQQVNEKKKLEKGVHVDATVERYIWAPVDSGWAARVALLSAPLGDGLPVTAWLRKPWDLLLEAADRLTGHPVGGDRSGHHTTHGGMKSFFSPLDCIKSCFSVTAQLTGDRRRTRTPDPLT